MLTSTCLAERARQEAADRRAKRSPSPKVQPISRRRVPPALPVPLRP
jgi:hypothetical protein